MVDIINGKELHKRNKVRTQAHARLPKQEYAQKRNVALAQSKRNLEAMIVHTSVSIYTINADAGENSDELTVSFQGTVALSFSLILLFDCRR